MQGLSASTYWGPSLEAFGPCWALLEVNGLSFWKELFSARLCPLRHGKPQWRTGLLQVLSPEGTLLVTWTDCLPSICLRNMLTNFCTQVTELELTGLACNAPKWFSWTTFLDSGTDIICYLPASIASLWSSHVTPCPGHELINSWVALRKTQNHTWALCVLKANWLKCLGSLEKLQNVLQRELQRFLAPLLLTHPREKCSLGLEVTEGAGICSSDMEENTFSRYGR